MATVKSKLHTLYDLFKPVKAGQLLFQFSLHIQKVCEPRSTQMEGKTKGEQASAFKFTIYVVDI